MAQHFEKEKPVKTETAWVEMGAGIAIRVPKGVEVVGSLGPIREGMYDFDPTFRGSSRTTMPVETPNFRIAPNRVAVADQPN